MIASTYSERRAAGLCVGTKTCRRPPVGAMCPRHRKIAAKANRRWRHEEYLRRKVAGDCTIIGCKERAAPDVLLCDKHHREHLEKCARPKRIAQLRAQVRAARAKLVARRLCSHCGHEPLVEGKKQGAKCLEKRRKKNREAYEKLVAAKGKTARRQRCGNCRREGCRADRCTYEEPLPDLPRLRIEDFAAARVGSAMGAA